MAEYKLINLRQDYYGNISAEELKGLYSVKNVMKKKSWKKIITRLIIISPTLILFGGLSVFFANIYGLEMLAYEAPLECVLYVIIYLTSWLKLVFDCIWEIGRWKDFFFGKGKIISLESEFFEGNKRRPEGYYRHTLTIAVSETEAVGNIFYFSDEPWKSEKYIGKEAAAVYFPKAHLLYAVIDGENADKYTEDFSDLMFVKKKKIERKK